MLYGGSLFFYAKKMITTMLGIKKGMTSTYDSRGRRVGATMVQITPNWVTQVNPLSIQLGFGTKKSVKKPQLGHSKKAGIETPIRWFREVRGQTEDMKPGTEIKLNQVFSKGDSIKVSAISKGKGFQGGVRLHGFAGGPKTHGQSDRHRAPGSIGSGTTPGRVYKGKKMAAHMGNNQVSTKGLEVVEIDLAENLITIKGAVPGPIGGLVTVTKLGRIKGYTPPPEEKPEEEDESESAEQRTSELENAEEQVAETTESVAEVEETAEAVKEEPNAS